MSSLVHRKEFQISLTVSPVSWLKLGCFLMSSASLIFLASIVVH